MSLSLRPLWAFALLLVPWTLPAQTKPPQWEVGGLVLTIGDSQTDVLSKLSSLYRVAYSEFERAFMVHCRQPDAFLLEFARVSFDGDRLNSISTFEERDCEVNAGRPSKVAQESIRKLSSVLQKVRKYEKGTCTIDVTSEEQVFGTPDVFSEVACGQAYRVQVTGHSDSFWSIIVVVK